MINFETELDLVGGTKLIRDTVPIVTDTLTVRREERTTDAGKDAATWTWEDLRSYVVREIEQRFGAFPRDPLKEKAIFSGFVKRHGDKAGPIAKFAFELCDGVWRNAPVAVQRFCKNSDPYFADIIANQV